MSWLFDRLSQLADADRLDVTVVCAPDPRIESLLEEAEMLPSTIVRRSALIEFDPDSIHLVAHDSDAAVFERLRLDVDLGIAIGAHAPGAHVAVHDVDDLVTLLATLFTLRSYVHAPAT